MNMGVHIDEQVFILFGLYTCTTSYSSRAYKIRHKQFRRISDLYFVYICHHISVSLQFQNKIKQ